jgi:hypothetical protein
MPNRISPALALACLMLLPAQARAEPPKAAVFDFELNDQGIIGPTEADRARLAPLAELLRTLLADSGRYSIVSIDPVRADVAKTPGMRRCNGCAADFARTLGADVVVTGDIQKVSNLILNINVYVQDLRGNAPEKGYSVDIRGNNDVSFDRGLRFLVRNNLPPPDGK